jgi:hypothetical protein
VRLLEGTRATGIGQRHNVGFGYFAMYRKSILVAESGQAEVRISRSVNELLGTLTIWSPADPGGIGDMRGHEYGIRIENLIEAHSVRD